MHVRVQEPKLSPIANDVLHGLTGNPKTLSPKLFYDELGSELFDRITELPEYYLTGTEREIFRLHAPEMIEQCGGCNAVVELGAGSAAKTVLILDALVRSRKGITYYPVDVSASALDACSHRMQHLLPSIRVVPKVLDFTHVMPQVRRIPGRKLFLFIGSSIGNFEPLHAGLFLKQVRSSMNAGDALLLGTDMRKPREMLIPAYDDPAGVTAQFNKNLLVRINRELDGDFDLDQFAHRIVWNGRLSRIEMHLESLRDQTVTLSALEQSIHFNRGETIHTENSYKFTMPMVRAIAGNGGFTIEHTWSDPRRWFTVHLLRA
ncbi:MAG TPA: L-histidine N(alpha)-methyltransferase [Candidatus Koribacter sp.]|jgi:dimethylhistidine N-methyltransferase